MGSYAVLANKFSRIYLQLVVNELLSYFFIFSKSQTMELYWQAMEEKVYSIADKDNPVLGIQFQIA